MQFVLEPAIELSKIGRFISGGRQRNQMFSFRLNLLFVDIIALVFACINFTWYGELTLNIVSLVEILFSTGMSLEGLLSERSEASGTADLLFCANFITLGILTIILSYQIIGIFTAISILAVAILHLSAFSRLAFGSEKDDNSRTASTFRDEPVRENTGNSGGRYKGEIDGSKGPIHLDPEAGSATETGESAAAGKRRVNE